MTVRSRRAQRGQAAIMLTMSLPMMFGLLALVCDVGWAYWRREAAKTAASAAAAAVVAAAGSTTPTSQSSTQCPSTLNTSLPWEVGCDFAVHNGFTNGSSNRTVAIAIGTTSPPVSGVSPSNYWVSATVTEQLPSWFSTVLGQSGLNITGRSTVAVYGASGSGGGCIYAMETIGNGWIMSGGNVTSDCGIYVNSSIIASGGSVTTTGGAKTYYVSSVVNPQYFSPAPIKGSVVSDPFASLTAPSTTGLPTFAGVSMSSGSRTLQPGIYTGVISVSGGTLQITPGEYVLQGGISISGGTVSETATGGELFYCTGGGISMSGSTITLHAQTTGNYKGILFYQPASNTSALSYSGGGLNLTGAFYAKGAQISMSGGTFNHTTIVVNNIQISGGNQITIDGPASTVFNQSMSYLVE